MWAKGAMKVRNKKYASYIYWIERALFSANGSVVVCVSRSTTSGYYISSTANHNVAELSLCPLKSQLNAKQTVVKRNNLGT